jgi:nitroimidazol reductase NimA-like FMN-containing flavoprotein (pyridoxamine 5'-phosphate oxidase superfamily)
MSRRPFAVRDLSTEEALAFLDGQQVGRLAYAFERRVDIVPVHYVHRDGWLYGRTSPSPKLRTLAHSHWVAFEVDEIRGLLDWTSVVVRGSFHPLDPAGSDQERETYALALDVVRSLFPDTLTDGDFAPERTVLFRIHVDEVTGREGSTG